MNKALAVIVLGVLSTSVLAAELPLGSTPLWWAP